MPVRISDVMSQPTWRRTALRSEVLADVADQMTVPLRRNGPALQALALGRSSGTFTDRQRDVLGRVTTHVRAAVRRAAPGGAVGLRLAPDPRWVPLTTAPGLDPAIEEQPPPGSGLSPRERQVLELVADGLTDAQVARRLGISPATVSRHLHRVYTRHAIPNRAAALRLLGA
jgi:DNA-binding CsgD family transcriptional regulator